MPYKDAERKREWEREHREERNARRRKTMSRSSPEPLVTDAMLPDPISAKVALTRTNVVIGGIMGLAFLLTVLIMIWRFGSSAHPGRNYLTLGSPGSR
jgi:hypothetical protein